MGKFLSFNRHEVFVIENLEQVTSSGSDSKSEEDLKEENFGEKLPTIFNANLRKKATNEYLICDGNSGMPKVFYLNVAA